MPLPIAQGQEQQQRDHFISHLRNRREIASDQGKEEVFMPN